MSVSFSWSKAGDTRAQNTQKPAVDAKQTVPIADQLQRVHDAWNPQSPACAFQHYFYNRVPAEQAQQYVMPPGQDPQKWERAMIARPDPASVPVLAVGFTDLEKRMNLQNQQVNAYRVRMHEINDKLTELSNRHDLHTTVKLLEMREKHNHLAKRALELAIRIQMLGNRGRVLTPQEELFMQRVKELIRKADDPAVFGSLNEAWARVKAFKERDTAKDAASASAERIRLDWESNPQQLELIIKVLAAQQKGITFLAQLIENDMQLVDEDLGLVPKKPKQKALPVTTVAPQSFAAQIPTSHMPQVPPQGQGQGQGQAQGQLQGQSKPGLQTANGTGASQGGLFGQAPASGGLFGRTQNQTGGLFGQTQNQTQTQTGGLFGQNRQQAPASGGLFGQTQPPAATSGGLFGQNQTQTPAATSGGLFGQTQNQAPAGGLFGQTQNQTQNQTQSQFGGGLFGQNQAQNQTPATTSGGLFGQNQAQAPSSGPFGQNQNQASGGLFGQNQTDQNKRPFGGSLFGK